MTPAQRKAAAVALAAAIAVPAEGLRQTYYYDPPGILTVCYGHTGGVEKSKTYSLDECKALLNEDMNHAVNIVEHCAPGLPLPALAAFADAVYNIGPKVACDTERSTAARMLKAGDIAGACNQLPRWDKAMLGGVAVSLPGLTKRRNKEQALCLTAV